MGTPQAGRSLDAFILVKLELDVNYVLEPPRLK
jgi:hypothetical protein